MTAATDRLRGHFRDAGNTLQAAVGLFLHHSYRELSTLDKQAPAEIAKKAIDFVLSKAIPEGAAGLAKALGSLLKAAAGPLAERVLANYHATTEHALAMTGSVLEGGAALEKMRVPDLHGFANAFTGATVDDPDWHSKLNAAIDAAFPKVEKRDVVTALVEGHLAHKDQRNLYGLVRRHGSKVYALDANPTALRHAEARDIAERIVGGAK